ncbi:MAG: tRNA-dihydrouridine synthase, partial [Desulfobacula sp.]|nr:tRNA-dihydrouridine synthase [Desulfobacula sp.]
SGQQALDIAQIAQDCGVDAIAVHPRTASQLFKGKSDWQLIKQVKKKISIPIIGNGDINSVEDAGDMIRLTKCDAVMVGRAAMRNPFILSQIDDFLETGYYKAPSSSDIFRIMERLTHVYVNYFGEDIACKMLRGRLSWFVKGWPDSSTFRKHLSHIRSMEQALSLIKEFEAKLQ